MVRPKKSATASRANGAAAAKKQTHKRVPTLTLGYDEDFVRGRDTISSEDMYYTLDYRPPLPKGCFYPDEMYATTRCLSKAKRVHFEKPPPSPERKSWRLIEEKQYEAEKKAALLLTKLNKDPKVKARKIQSLVKGAGFEFKLSPDYTV